MSNYCSFSLQHSYKPVTFVGTARYCFVGDLAYTECLLLVLTASCVHIVEEIGSSYLLEESSILDEQYIDEITKVYIMYGVEVGLKYAVLL